MIQENYIKGIVSVGIPTYNRPQNLKKALEIITGQTYKNLEIIISDNASTDPEVKQVVDFYSKSDSRIKYFKQEVNCGVLANADYVLKKATGEYFMWFSDDDWRSPEFVELLVDELECNEEFNMAFCDYREVYEDGSSANGYPATHLRLFQPYQSQNRLVRILNYYWQNPVLGKCNIFYSLFRKSELDKLDLKELTEGYRHLNMDNLIVFSMLQLGPVKIISEVMCTLTCGNKKYYFSENQIRNNRIKGIYNYAKKQLIDLFLYSKFTTSKFEKSIFSILFIPKFLNELLQICVKKILAKGALFNKETTQLSHLKNDLESPKIKLPNVTLVAVATRNVEENLKAILYSCEGIEFGKVKLLSHYTPYYVENDVEFIRIQKMKDIDQWSHFIVYDLDYFIDTDYIILVHSDGFIVNPFEWKDDFLNYDYIGAPWPLPSDDFSYRDIHGNIVRVGNSVSLRSKKLLALPKKINIPWESDHGYFNEDGFVCVKNKHIFEEHGMRFADIDIAKYFAHEVMIPEIENIKPFAFHKWEGSNRNYPKF
jgi:glycosyltransferase involved in cell wall biosynthesis